MRKIMLSFLIAALGFAAAQDVGRAAPPSVDALWALLGSISTVELEVRSPEVRHVLLVTMYQGEAVVSDHDELSPEQHPRVTLSAGALRPEVAPCPDGVAVFLHHQKVYEAGGGGEGFGRRCVEIEGLLGLNEGFLSSPLSEPREGGQEASMDLPLDTWLLFGTTDLFIPNQDEPDKLENSLAAYFLLSTELIVPLPDQWELPAYETQQEALEAFE